MQSIKYFRAKRLRKIHDCASPKSAMQVLPATGGRRLAGRLRIPVLPLRAITTLIPESCHFSSRISDRMPFLYLARCGLVGGKTLDIRPFLDCALSCCGALCPSKPTEGLPVLAIL